MVQAFETWVELHDLVRRMKRLASRVMGGTKTHTMEVWKKFVIDCRKLKKDAAFEYNRKYVWTCNDVVICIEISGYVILLYRE